MTTPAKPPRFPRRTYQMCYYGFSGFLIFAALGVGQSPVPPMDRPTMPRPTGPTLVAADATSPLDEPLRPGRGGPESLPGSHGLQLHSHQKGTHQRPNDAGPHRHLEGADSAVQRLYGWRSRETWPGKKSASWRTKHGNRMRVRSAGGLRLIGWVNLDQNDPLARETSRHAIAEAGLANLIEDVTPPIGRRSAPWAKRKRTSRSTSTTSGVARESRQYTPRTRQDSSSISARWCTSTRSRTADPRRVLRLSPAANDPGELIEVYSYVNFAFQRRPGRRDV